MVTRGRINVKNKNGVITPKINRLHYCCDLTGISNELRKLKLNNLI